ncbi:MAG TPA: ferrochelatase, partial [Oceanicaulis sp.]|nr:ferrochelatase [Oceanicaulis sp.]
VPALGDQPDFIAALARVTVDALEGGNGLKPPQGQPICPGKFGRCPCLEAGLKQESAA